MQKRSALTQPLMMRRDYGTKDYDEVAGSMVKPLPATPPPTPEEALADNVAEIIPATPTGDYDNPGPMIPPSDNKGCGGPIAPMNTSYDDLGCEGPVSPPMDMSYNLECPVCRGVNKYIPEAEDLPQDGKITKDIIILCPKCANSAHISDFKKTASGIFKVKLSSSSLDSDFRAIRRILPKGKDITLSSKDASAIHDKLNKIYEFYKKIEAALSHLEVGRGHNIPSIAEQFIKDLKRSSGATIINYNILEGSKDGLWHVLLELRNDEGVPSIINNLNKKNIKSEIVQKDKNTVSLNFDIQQDVIKSVPIESDDKIAEEIEKLLITTIQDARIKPKNIKRGPKVEYNGNYYQVTAVFMKEKDVINILRMLEEKQRFKELKNRKKINVKAPDYIHSWEEPTIENKQETTISKSIVEGIEVIIYIVPTMPLRA